jgi:hypothetical protein
MTSRHPEQNGPLAHFRWRRLTGSLTFARTRPTMATPVFTNVWLSGSEVGLSSIEKPARVSNLRPRSHSVVVGISARERTISHTGRVRVASK